MFRRLLSALAFLPFAAHAADLAPGAKAPDFSLQGSDGRTYALSQFTGDGKHGVVLAWFPKAFTPG